MRWWKVLGLAGLAGVAATGVITVEAERRRRAYTPDEIRARLHERVAAATEDDAVAAVPASTTDAGTGERGGLRGRLAAARLRANDSLASLLRGRR